MKKSGWKGVKNVTDSKSKDLWAKHVGWYVATIDGEEYSFSLLSDALKAYDISTINNKGLNWKLLNRPEGWKGIADEASSAAAAAATTKKGNNKSSSKKNPKTATSQARPPVPATNIAPNWMREFHTTPQGDIKCEYVSPNGMRFKTIADARKYLKLLTQHDGELDAGSKATKQPPSANTELVWTKEEIELAIELDERYDSMKALERYKKMTKKLTRFNEIQIKARLQYLRRQVHAGKIWEYLEMSSIKTTLCSWTPEQINMLMKVEEWNKDEDEDTKNAKIGYAIPRWNQDKCAFKTRVMRWETKILEEKAEKDRRKKQREADKARKEALSGMTMATPAKMPASTETAMKSNALPTPTPLQSAKKQQSGKDDVAQSDSKIDDKFAEILRNDPYLAGKRKPETVEEIMGNDPKSGES